MIISKPDIDLSEVHPNEAINPLVPLYSVVAEHIEHRLVQPKRLEHIVSRALDRREERTKRRTTPNCASVRPKQKPSSSGCTTPLKMESRRIRSDAQGSA